MFSKSPNRGRTSGKDAASASDFAYSLVVCLKQPSWP